MGFNPLATLVPEKKHWFILSWRLDGCWSWSGCIGDKHGSKGGFPHSMPRPCRSPAMPCCQGFRMCLSHLIYIVRPCLIHTCHASLMPCSHHAIHLKVTAQCRRDGLGAASVRHLPAITRSSTKLLSGAYQSQMHVATMKPNVHHGRGKAYYFGART
jgi:hypothetical protein